MRLRGAFRKSSSDEGEALEAAGQVPFGPMLAGAGILYYLALSEHVDAYFAQVSRLLAASAGY